MNKKIFVLSIILILIIAFTRICFAADIVMDLNQNSTPTPSNDVSTDEGVPNTDTTSPDAVDDTTIHPTTTEDSTEDILTTTSATDYEDSGDLSVTNMINIILIVVGVVLVLLGIAIILRLK